MIIEAGDVFWQLKTYRNIELRSDFVAASAKPGSKGVRLISGTNSR